MFGASSLHQKVNRLESNKPGSAFKEILWFVWCGRQIGDSDPKSGGGSEARREQRTPNRFSAGHGQADFLEEVRF